MVDKRKVNIKKLDTGVPGLNEVLGGGLPEYSFNIIAGAPGGGKTTLAHQIMFANASEESPAIFFTVLGEPAIKMLRYQQQFEFFKAEKLNKCVHFINLNHIVLEQDLDQVLDEIVKQVEIFNPGIVVVDSFRTVMRESQVFGKGIALQSFVQKLALHLTSWQATTFLIGEYTEAEIRDNPVSTVSDGLFWLYQNVERSSIVRKLQVMKSRGQESIPGLHTFRITSAGVQIFPRTLGLEGKRAVSHHKERYPIGIPELDALIGGGIPSGDSFLVAGPAGSGKSIIATQFIAEGIRNGQAGLVAIFEEKPEEYARKAIYLDFDVKEQQDKGLLRILYLRPLDLSVDETISEILAAVKTMGTRRLVIDSLVGFEMALAPSYRADFRESLYRMMGALKRSGVTVMSTIEVENSFSDLKFTPYSISFLCDDMLRLRYVEIDAELRKVMVVIKMRRSGHSKEIREYNITEKGVVVEPIRMSGFHTMSASLPQSNESKASID